MNYSQRNSHGAGRSSAQGTEANTAPDVLQPLGNGHPILTTTSIGSQASVVVPGRTQVGDFTAETPVSTLEDTITEVTAAQVKTEALTSLPLLSQRQG